MASLRSSRMRSFLIGTAGLAALLALLPLSTSAQLDTQVRDEAFDALRSGKYKEAIGGLRQHLRRNREDAESWYWLAYSLHSQKRYKDAIPAYEEAISRKYRPVSGSYNIACALAMDGQTEAALDALDVALDTGFNNARQYQVDSDLASLMELERFKEIVARASDPTGHYPTALSLRKLAAVWDATSDSGVGGRAEASLASNGFAMPFSLVVADSRVIGLMLYFSTSEDSWYAIGADQAGGAYDGPVSLSADEMVAFGKRATDNGIEGVRMVFSWQGDDSAVLSLDVMAEGEWLTESSYSLSRAAPARAQ